MSDNNKERERIGKSIGKLHQDIYKKYPFLLSTSFSDGKLRKLSLSEMSIAYYNLENIKAQRMREITMILVVMGSLLISIIALLF